jgi:hypothetical protein
MGCFNLVDSPMGPTHASSTPQVGDILVGSFTPALQRGKLPFEFKQWCCNGKPLLELLRILQFGSKMSKGELHTMLRQPASVTANFALRLQSATLKAHERALATQASEAQDDIWLLARALCFCELTPDPKLKLSKPHFDILSQLAMTTLDESMLEDLQKIMPVKHVEEVPFVNPFHQVPQYKGYGQDGSKTPEYGGSSPVFSPPSPKASPKQGNTPPYAPSSPAFAPSSPPYVPESPPYRPMSPEEGAVDPAETAKALLQGMEPLPPPPPQSILSKLLSTIKNPPVSYADI